MCKSINKIKNHIFTLLLVIVACLSLGKGASTVLASDTTSISKEMLSVKCQAKRNADGTADLRIVSTVDENLELYKTVGFDIQFMAGLDSEGNLIENEPARNIPYQEGHVSYHIDATVDDVEFDFNPKVFHTSSEYFITVTVTGIPASYHDNYVLIKPFVTLTDDKEVKTYGESRYITINDGFAGNVLSIPFEGNITGDVVKGTTTTVGALSGTFEEPYYDEATNYTHVRINLGENKTNELKSVTELTIGDSPSKYRNLHSTATTADTSWYTAMNSDANDEFVIVTRADLLGFSALVDGDTDAGTITFANEKIYMGGDITVNNYTKEEMQASATGTGTVISDLISWDPIGTVADSATGAPFAGKFDGMNQTISGLYQKHETDWNGLFYATTSGCEVKNLRLENSYFYKTTVKTAERPSGGIVAIGAGTFEGIYCDVILHNSTQDTGGIIGNTGSDYGNVTIKNCWFAGEIIAGLTSDQALYIGGLLGRVQGGITATIENCLFTGNIDCGERSRTKTLRVGGIFGQNNASKTTLDCVLSIGNIKSNGSCSEIGAILGGTAGTNSNNITNTYLLDTVCAYAQANGATIKVAKAEKQFTSANLIGDAAKSGPSGLFGTDSCWTTQVISHPIPSSFQWYDETRRVLDIDNAVELYEFAKVSKTNNFKNQIVRLTADITVNEGTSEEIKDIATTALQWTPIGTSASNNYPFAGTFDGQGHTISGLCANAVTGEKALFQGTASTSVIKNLKLVNSYFATGFASGVTTSVNRRVGGIAVFGGGTFDTIYCDVLLENYNKMTGGIIADVHNSHGGAVIKNCQFAGDIDVTNCTSELSTGGLVGYIRANTTIEDCLMTGTITYGTIRMDADMSVGGVIGEVGTDSLAPSVTVTDAVNVGTITGSGGKYIGSYIGNINDGSVATTDVYIKNRIAVDEIGRNANGIVTGEIHVEPKENLVAQKASGLDFSTTWFSLYNSTPVLRDHFDGTTFTNTSYYETKNAIASTPRTFEAWIKVDADLPGTVRPGIIAGNYDDTQDTTPQGFSFELNTNGQPSLWWNDGENTAKTSKFGIVDLRTGEWVHLAVVVDEENGQASCYVNGEFKQTIKKQCDMITELRKFRIGVDYRSDNSVLSPEYVELASVALFDDMRSVAEIQADMSNIDTQDTSLLGLYDISDKEPDALKDLSSYENHLTSTSGIEGMSFATDKLFMMNETLSEVPKTFEAYVFLPSDAPSGGTYDQSVILSNYVDTQTPYIRFDLFRGKPRISMGVGNDVTYGQTFTNAISTNKWTHIAVTFEDDAWTCYIDGEVKETLPVDESKGLVVSDSMCTNPMCFGGDTTNPAKYFKGTIAKVAAYSDVRTPEEIVADMNSYGTDDLLVEYNTTYLPEDTTVVQDQTSNNYDAMLNGWINPEEYDGVSNYVYSFAVIGDTQRVNSEYPDKFVGIYDWIIANAESKTMKMVLGLGDITQNNTEAEWLRAQANIQRLDAANIPYTVIRGNEGHDEIEQFNQYFSYDAYKNTLQGFYTEGDMTNAWRKIEVNGIKYLIMMLDFGPSDAVLEWAGGVIEANPNYNVIITTHAYLYRDGTTIGSNADHVYPPSSYEGKENDNDGNDIWDKLVSQHDNIVLVLSGHDITSNIVTTQTVGKNNRNVTQMLINPQNMDFNTGPAGMVAMLYFSADGKTVQVEYYSTARDQYWKASNQFTVTLDVVE